MCPTETTKEDTRMRGSTRTDAAQRKKTNVKLHREKMQACNVIGEAFRHKLVKSN